MRPFPHLCILVTILVLGCSSPDEPRQPPPGDIILITVDTLRADHLGLYGYERDTTPNIDRWFADGAIYLRSYATNAATSQSVASILSGLLPQGHRVRVHFQLLPSDVALIPDLLPEEFQTVAFVSNTVLTDEAMGMAERFDHYDDFVDQRESSRKIYERNAGRTTDAALTWLREGRDPQRPLFLWIHYIDPHGPYRPPEEWPRRFGHDKPVEIDIGRLRPWQREPGVSDGLAYLDAYDEEIAYVDAQIGRLLDGFAELHSIDETLIILGADHGETMMEHEKWFTHSYEVYEAITRVPLMLRGPGVEPLRSDLLTSGIDIAPTLLLHAGVPLPEEMSAVDLRDGSSLTADRVVFVEARGAAHHHGAIGKQGKWVLSVDPGTVEVVGRRFYDLGGDPQELHPRGWPEEDRVGRQLDEICRSDPDPAGVPVRMRRGNMLDAPKIDPRASPEDLERLRALGYVQ